MNNLHWAITAYNENIGERLPFAVDIQVRHQKTEEEELIKAKELIKRENYFVRSVLECDCAKHNLQHFKTLEINKDLVKAMKKQFTSNDEDNG